MALVKYSATFTLPNGKTHKVTRGSRQDYGYTFAWIVVDENCHVLIKGFSRTAEKARQSAEACARYAEGRRALYADVTK